MDNVQSNIYRSGLLPGEALRHVQAWMIQYSGSRKTGFKIRTEPGTLVAFLLKIGLSTGE